MLSVNAISIGNEKDGVQG